MWTTSLRKVSAVTANPMPSTVPATPMKKPWKQKQAATWRGLPPSAPSRPISRVLRTTAMSSELVIANAATSTMKSSRKKSMFFSSWSTKRKSRLLSIHETAWSDPSNSALSFAANSSESNPGYRRTLTPCTPAPSP